MARALAESMTVFPTDPAKSANRSLPPQMRNLLLAPEPTQRVLQFVILNEEIMLGV